MIDARLREIARVYTKNKTKQKNIPIVKLRSECVKTDSCQTIESTFSVKLLEKVSKAAIEFHR